MIPVKFLKGLKKNLSAYPISEGNILFTTDEQIFYLDIPDPKDSSKIIRVAVYPEELIKARTNQSNQTYPTLKDRIDAIPYIQSIERLSEVSIPYIKDTEISKEDTYSSSKIMDLLTWGSWQ